MKKIVFVLLLASLLLSGNLKVHASSTASFSVNGAAYAPGSTFSVPVYESSGPDMVTVIEADITYDSSLLKVTATDFSDSSFPNNLKTADSGGTLSMIRYVPGGVSGQAKVGNVTFTQIVSQPSTSIAFADTSHIYANGKDIWDGNTTGATFDFPAPAAVAAPPAASSTPSSAVSKPQRAAAPIVRAAAPDPASVLNSTATAPHFVDSTALRASNQPWEAVIWACCLVIAALLIRLFNLHKKLKAKIVVSHKRRKAKRRRRKSKASRRRH
jgi:hypothetical protein